MINNTMLEAVRVSAGADWATIAYGGWQDQATRLYAGELLVRSSRGTWGVMFPALGRPLNEFLLDVPQDYLLDKLSGGARELDYAATLLSWKLALVGARRARLITEDELRDAWDDSCYGTSTTSAQELIARLVASRPASTARLRVPLPWDEVSMYVRFGRPHGANAFWSVLWPLFTRSLEGRLQPANDETAVAA